VWCIYIGTGHAARFDKHLKVDILNIFLKGKGKFIFELLSNIATILFFIVLAMIMVNVLQFFTLRVQTSAALKLNMIYVYSAPFVCSLLSTLRYIENIARLTLGFKASKGNGNAREAS
jgi:TRAP-type C4-dicarboxylate transport system permease small subunit